MPERLVARTRRCGTRRAGASGTRRPPAMRDGRPPFAGRNRTTRVPQLPYACATASSTIALPAGAPRPPRQIRPQRRAPVDPVTDTAHEVDEQQTDAAAVTSRRVNPATVARRTPATRSAASSYRSRARPAAGRRSRRAGSARCRRSRPPAAARRADEHEWLRLDELAHAHAQPRVTTSLIRSASSATPKRCCASSSPAWNTGWRG